MQEASLSDVCSLKILCGAWSLISCWSRQSPMQGLPLTPVDFVWWLENIASCARLHLLIFHQVFCCWSLSNDQAASCQGEDFEKQHRKKMNSQTYWLTRFHCILFTLHAFGEDHQQSMYVKMEGGVWLHVLIMMNEWVVEARIRIFLMV